MIDLSTRDKVVRAMAAEEARYGASSYEPVKPQHYGMLDEAIFELSKYYDLVKKDV